MAQSAWQHERGVKAGPRRGIGAQARLAGVHARNQTALAVGRRNLSKTWDGNSVDGCGPGSRA